MSSPVTVKSPATVTFWLASIVKAVVPPVAIVITSEPLKVIEVLESSSPAILSNCMLPTFVIAESLKSNVPVTSKLPSTVKLPSMVVSAPSASSIISPLESTVTSVPSFVIVSKAILPTLVILLSPNDTSLANEAAPPNVSVPDISTLPFISTVVAAICISVSATKSSCPSVDELIYIAVSLNCNFSVLATSMSSENSK